MSKEKGQASINISLDDGIITVTHSDGPILIKWLSRGNDWDLLWSRLNSLKSLGDEKEGIMQTAD